MRNLFDETQVCCNPNGQSPDTTRKEPQPPFNGGTYIQLPDGRWINPFDEDEDELAATRWKGVAGTRLFYDVDHPHHNVVYVEDTGVYVFEDDLTRALQTEWSDPESPLFNNGRTPRDPRMDIEYVSTVVRPLTRREMVDRAQILGLSDHYLYSLVAQLAYGNNTPAWIHKNDPDYQHKVETYAREHAPSEVARVIQGMKSAYSYKKASQMTPM